MTASLGASSCNSPSCLAAKSPTVWTTPVTLPPGRLRLTTKPVLTGSKTGGEDDRDRRSGRFGDRRRKSVGHDHGDLAADELRRHRRKPIIPILGKAILDSDVLPLDKSGLVQALPECANQVSEPAAAVERRKPITGITGCCARAVSGHAAAAPPSSVMNARRLIRSPRRRGRPAAAEW